MEKTNLTRQTEPNSAPEHGPSWHQRKLSGKKASWLRNCLAVRYRPDLLIAMTLISGLNILDYFFTMVILDQGGKEINPFVQSAMETWGDHFWIWKFSIVSLNVILLCLHSKFKYVKKIILGICLVYLATVLYQIRLMAFH